MQSHHNLALFIELLSWKGVKTCENVNYQRTSLPKSWANSIEVYSSLQFLKLIQLSLSRGTNWHARRTHTCGLWGITKHLRHLRLASENVTHRFCMAKSRMYHKTSTSKFEVSILWKSLVHNWTKTWFVFFDLMTLASPWQRLSVLQSW